MAALEFVSNVGPDGVLHVAVPTSFANQKVKVSVEPVDESQTPPRMSPEAWRKFIESTAGKWQGEPPGRPDQGEFEQREPWP